MKKFRESHKKTILIDGYVSTYWMPWSKEYYENIGYKFTGLKQQFLVKSSDLSPKSGIRVQVACPVCYQIRNAKMNDITKMGHSCCYKCARVLNLYGKRFGKWTVIDIDWKRRHEQEIRWVCVCDCGNVKSLRAAIILKEKSKSCGCSSGQFISKKISGKKHYRYDHSKTKEERLTGRFVPSYNNWRKIVYRKSKYKCAVCGSKKSLCAHHLFSYAHYPSKRTDPENGILLCRKHHYDFHVRFMGGWKVPCTKGDYNRWAKEKVI